MTKYHAPSSAILPTPTQKLYWLALKAAAEAATANKHIYSVNFCKHRPAMDELIAGADPVQGLAKLLISLQNSPNVISSKDVDCATDYLLCCCSPSDIPKIRNLIAKTNPNANLNTISEMTNPIIFRLLFWLEENYIESGQFYSKIVDACRCADDAALCYWTHAKGIDATSAVPYFYDDIASLPFLTDTIELDKERLTIADFKLKSRTNPNSHLKIYEFFSALRGRNAIHVLLDKSSKK